MVKKNDKENTDNEPVTRTHRSQTDLAIDKCNRAFTNIEKQNANLIKAKRNVLLSGDKELGDKFNTALGNFAITLTSLQIVDTDWNKETPTKIDKPTFDISNVETVDEISDD